MSCDEESPSVEFVGETSPNASNNGAIDLAFVAEEITGKLSPLITDLLEKFEARFFQELKSVKFNIEDIGETLNDVSAVAMTRRSPSKNTPLPNAICSNGPSSRNGNVYASEGTRFVVSAKVRRDSFSQSNSSYVSESSRSESISPGLRVGNKLQLPSIHKQARRPSRVSNSSTFSLDDNSLHSAASVVGMGHLTLEGLMRQVDDMKFSSTKKMILESEQYTSNSDSVGDCSNVSIDENCQSDHFQHGAIYANMPQNATYLEALKNLMPRGIREGSMISSFAPIMTRDLNGMRQSRQDEVLAAVQKVPSVRVSKLGTSRWLYVVGILPWPHFRHSCGTLTCCRRLNRIVVQTIIICIVGFSLYRLFYQEADDSCKKMDICIENVLSPTIALGIGCILRLGSSAMYNDEVVGHSDAILTNHISSIGATALWILYSRMDIIKIVFFWLLVVVAVAYRSIMWSQDALQTALHLFCFGFTTHIFIASAFDIMHICRGLYLGIDDFCLQIVQNRSLDDAISSWNILHAVLRRVCTTVARSFILLLTSALAAVFFPVVIDTKVLAMVPGAFAVLVILWVSLYIGGVTSKCDRVAAFVNMLDFGEDFDQGRQYVVGYIMNSRAGFYMFDVRVTGEMVFKSAYVGCVLAAAFTTTALSRHQ